MKMSTKKKTIIFIPPQGAHTNGGTVDVQNYKGMYGKIVTFLLE